MGIEGLYQGPVNRIDQVDHVPPGTNAMAGERHQAVTGGRGHGENFSQRPPGHFPAKGAFPQVVPLQVPGRPIEIPDLDDLVESGRT